MQKEHQKKRYTANEIVNRYQKMRNWECGLTVFLLCVLVPVSLLGYAFQWPGQKILVAAYLACAVALLWNHRCPACGMPRARRRVEARTCFYCGVNFQTGAFPKQKAQSSESLER